MKKFDIEKSFSNKDFKTNPAEIEKQSSTAAKNISPIETVKILFLLNIENSPINFLIFF